MNNVKVEYNAEQKQYIVSVYKTDNYTGEKQWSQKARFNLERINGYIEYITGGKEFKRFAAWKRNVEEQFGHYGKLEWEAIK